MHDHPLWAEVDLSAIVHNLNEVKRLAGPLARIMAVVKADAYGHGAVPVARAAVENGAQWLGVARAAEGIALRKAGIRQPVLVFGYSPPGLAPVLARYSISQTVSSVAMAKAISEAATSAGAAVSVHLKVDTGMGRLGLVPDALRGKKSDSAGCSAVGEAMVIAGLDGLVMEGLYTHFAASDSADKTSAKNQLERFCAFVSAAETAGIRPDVIHAANSAAVIDLMPEACFDLVRPGIMLYGLYPSGEMDRSRANLKPALQVKARIGQVKSVPPGFAVSYGSTWRAPASTRIATVPVGYADGYSRTMSSRGEMVVRGRRAPVVGRVCMDQTMLDVGGIPDVAPGDEAVILGTRGQECISADELASALGTINYEVVSTLMARVPRIYR